ncbi:hypothetical protein H0O00_02655 [Candidatus Micrarchaeota archaeon]|nr:hypothetical protein [Candidatus Micrarchaeota archaeon]
MNKAVKKSRKERIGEDVSYLDLNQLELAYINRAVEEGRRPAVPPFVEIGNSRRILLIQKTNLESLCRQNGKEYRKGPLEGELRGVLGGRKGLSIGCFLFK